VLKVATAIAWLRWAPDREIGVSLAAWRPDLTVR